MNVSTRNFLAFTTVAIIAAIPSFFAASISRYVHSFQNTDLPMAQHLSQLGKANWKAHHAVDAYLATADPHFSIIYRDCFDEAQFNFQEFLKFVQPQQQNAAIAKFRTQFDQAQQHALDAFNLVQQYKEAQDNLFVFVDTADDVIDFQLQDRFDPADPDILAKEQNLREVEVSIWEAIHAAQQYVSLSPDITRADHAQHTFAELMEKQFRDVDEFWHPFVALPHSKEERQAIADFETQWGLAVIEGRKVVQLHDQVMAMHEQITQSAARLDQTVDTGLRGILNQRIAHNIHVTRNVTILVYVLAVFALFVALSLARLFTVLFWKRAQKLIDGISALSQGDLHYRIPLPEKDDMTQIGRAFNHMADRLLASTEKLKVEIKHRTAAEEALELSNAELSSALSSLSTLNQDLRDFVYIASHDLREPLRKISSFGALLKQSLGDRLEADDHENLMFMVDGADRMNRMIEGLLSYSRLNTAEHIAKPVDLNIVIKELQQLELAACFEETHAVVSIPAPLPIVLGDPMQITHLLQNLMGNAIKYHRDDVEPLITVTAETSRGQANISIQDNGIGIAEEHYDNIFKMFRRLHSHKKFKGNGIGLALCKRIVEKHGGTIGVTSSPQQGSTFFFTLPLDQPAESPADDAIAFST